MYGLEREDNAVSSIRNIFTEGPGLAICALLSRFSGLKAHNPKYGLLLQAAATLGNHSLAELLMSRGVDVNLVGCFYGTALQSASRHGHLGIVESLLQAGAAVNAFGGEHDTALRAAIRGKHLEVFKTLLSHGADVHLKKDSNSPSALEVAGDCDALDMLGFSLLEPLHRSRYPRWHEQYAVAARKETSAWFECFLTPARMPTPSSTETP
ncbi:ankyrin repeat-containing domain protein [Podospora didyma]|uniref:Ankyrin repeat-containing domain protein n=1 Tax=Podospora didyma TaxID=330526 RepID=A0AAE0NHI4_9PEZI|nr:ankyrin repeat-containing domain protein [Podospora didyma]